MERSDLKIPPGPPLFKGGVRNKQDGKRGKIPARDRRNDGEKDECLIPTVGPDHVVEEDLWNSLRNVAI
jgi:hypothetical protein